MASEKNFENKIKRHIESVGGYLVKYFANRMTKVGIPDLLTCVNGYFLAIEVKAENGRPSDLQIYNIEKIRKSGGFAVIVKPHDFEKLDRLTNCLMHNNLSTAEDICDDINITYIHSI
jgi:Holliday junction resolvase